MFQFLIKLRWPANKSLLHLSFARLFCLFLFVVVVVVFSIFDIFSGTLVRNGIQVAIPLLCTVFLQE